MTMMIILNFAERFVHEMKNYLKLRIIKNKTKQWLIIKMFITDEIFFEKIILLIVFIISHLGNYLVSSICKNC